MLELKVKNEKGQILDFSQDPRYQVTASGVSPAAATVNVSKVAMNDGAKFNSSRVNERNIVLMVYLIKDIAAARLDLYRYFPPKHRCTLYLKNRLRDVCIDGYVEAVECDLYGQGQAAQVSILCPDPYFRAVRSSYVEIGKVLPLFEFPFAISKEGMELSQLYNEIVGTVLNEGDVAGGVTMELRATGKVTEPRIYNVQTRQVTGLHFEMQEGDRITINTNVGEKSVTLYRNGVTSNLINRLMDHPAWFQLETGANVFTYKCGEGDENFNMTFIFCARYMGV